ncbi:MAG: GTP-binding protein [Candidatus Geothermincolia bacterium]
MDRVFKIVVTGPFNSGKTTFIGAISEIEVVSTEKKTGKGGRRCNTTVAMDFGRITFPDGYVLHLYGTPGQERFDFMWEILSEGMLGYVVLVDGSKPDSFEEVDGIVKAFRKMSDKPCVIALTRSDRKDCLSPERVRKDIDRIGDVDIVKCDARKLADVKKVLLALLERVMERAEALEKTG